MIPIYLIVMVHFYAQLANLMKLRKTSNWLIVIRFMNRFILRKVTRAVVI